VGTDYITMEHVKNSTLPAWPDCVVFTVTTVQICQGWCIQYHWMACIQSHHKYSTLKIT